MASTGMEGSFPLTQDGIDNNVTQTSSGAYALGRTDSDDNKFIISYVGRSDDDINGRLKDWVGKYKRFKYTYTGSAKAAFEKECQVFHDFGGTENLDNKIHPDRPNGSGWECPVCTIFD